KLVSALAQLAQQPGILDGDDRLRREILDYVDLLVGKGADFLPEEYQATDDVTFLEHGNSENSAIAAKLGGRHCQRIALQVGLLDRDIDGLCRLLGHHRAAECYLRIGPHRPALHEISEGLRRVVICAEYESIGL